MAKKRRTYDAAPAYLAIVVEELLLRLHADAAQVGLVEVAVVVDDGLLGDEFEVIDRRLFSLGQRGLQVGVELASVLIAVVEVERPPVYRDVRRHPTLG